MAVAGSSRPRRRSRPSCDDDVAEDDDDELGDDEDARHAHPAEPVPSGRADRPPTQGRPPQSGGWPAPCPRPARGRPTPARWRTAATRGSPKVSETALSLVRCPPVPLTHGTVGSHDDHAWLKDHILGDVPDFPQAGVVFKDLTPLLSHPQAFVPLRSRRSPDPSRSRASPRWSGSRPGTSSLAAPVCVTLGAGFVPVRKKGQLPLAHRRPGLRPRSNGTDGLEIDGDAVASGDRVSSRRCHCHRGDRGRRPWSRWSAWAARWSGSASSSSSGSWVAVSDPSDAGAVSRCRHGPGRVRLARCLG